MARSRSRRKQKWICYDIIANRVRRGDNKVTLDGVEVSRNHTNTENAIIPGMLIADRIEIAAEVKQTLKRK